MNPGGRGPSELRSHQCTTAWATEQDSVSKKAKQTNKIISLAWGQAPVIPATQEAKAQKSLEPRRWKLQIAETTPLHFSLGYRARLHLQ